MSPVYVNGKPYKLDPTKSKGKGGEADIYEIEPGVVAKIFKTSAHPDFASEPRQGQEADLRLRDHQTKLRQFPKGLPQGLMAPRDLVTDASGNKVVGYTMPFKAGFDVLLSYAQRNFRASIDNNTVVEIFRGLRATLVGTHQGGVVLGDFNNLNVLVKGTETVILDADSAQFGSFICKLFTEKFVDPLNCDAKETSPKLCRPHSANSDWYAFTVMLMESLLFVGPYGGLYVPKDHAKRIPEGQRPLKRITVWDPEVRYPKPAISYTMLDDDMLHILQATFMKDQRAEFPEKALANMRWTKCSTCGVEHARNQCPKCYVSAPAAVITTTTIRGRVTATRIFKTSGILVFAAWQHGALRWVYNENSVFKREDGSLGMPGKVSPQMRFRVLGTKTVVGMGTNLVTLGPSMAVPPERRTTEAVGNRPIFDANGQHTYWIEGGRLVREGAFGAPEHIGDVLSNQTQFWVSDKFGFGFYRAGELSMAFVFDANRRGINDSVKLPRLQGQLVDSSCVFSGDLAWFTVTMQDKGKTINRAFCVDSKGNVLGEAQGEPGDDTWLGSIRSRCGMGKHLFVATDAGLVRVEASGGKLVQTQSYPDTEPFVDSSNQVFPGPQGIYVTSNQEITLLKLA